MLRLLFKVHSVHLKLKDQVQIQVVIRKGQEHILIPQKAKLINGVAILNAHAQFFISTNNPIFDIIVMILHHSGKKLAGVCEINLNEWQQNSNNKTTSILQKSADPSAIINFDFMYLSSNVQIPYKKLISLAQLQSQKKSQIIKQIEDKFSSLSKQNSRLVTEVAELKKQNKQLVENQEQMATVHSHNSQQFQTQLRQKSQIIINSQNNLNKMKQVIQKISEMINFYGESELKQKVGDLLEQKVHHIHNQFHNKLLDSNQNLNKDHQIDEQ